MAVLDRIGEDDSSLDCGFADEMGDDFDAPIMSRAKALALQAKLSKLTPAQKDARRPPHSMYGRISDRPRVALPSVPCVIPSAALATVQLAPQRPMRGPYWLGMTNAADLAVTRLMFANECAFNSCGEVPGSFFDVERPEHMIPISAQTLNLGNRVSIELRNRSCCTLEVLLTLWGTSGLDDHEPPASQLYRPDRVPYPAELEHVLRPRELSAPRACPGLPALESCSIEALQSAWCPACGQAMCGYSLAERFRRRAVVAEDRICAAQKQISEAEEKERAEQLEQREREQSSESIAERRRRVEYTSRRNADYLATEAHCYAAAPYEPGDIWETATDES